MRKKQRAFLKWAGGKYTLCDEINQLLPAGNRLVEPFVGAGSVFLNSNFKHYLLNDINQDLISLYQILQQQSASFIQDAARYFTPEFNQAERYYQLRQAFNDSTDSYQRALLFLYMNRHGYNGLCRYNKSGKFNVPFGKYKKPYFPQAEMEFFAEKAQHAIFTCLNYRDVFAKAQQGDVFYCDPPYVPLSKTASFTSYAGNGFGLDEQADLANISEATTERLPVSVLISNHDTVWTRKIYQNAKKIKKLQVARTISQTASKRKKVGELMALYQQLKKS